MCVCVCGQVERQIERKYVCNTEIETDSYNGMFAEFNLYVCVNISKAKHKTN